MKRLTNLQMSVIVDKIYRGLNKKIDVINKERLEKVDIKKELDGDVKLGLIKEYHVLEELRNKYEKQMMFTKEAYRVENGGEYLYRMPTEEEYILKLKTDKGNLIYLDKQDIEANVILSDVTDIETLIETITKNITKDIPELN